MASQKFLPPGRGSKRFERFAELCELHHNLEKYGNKHWHCNGSYQLYPCTEYNCPRFMKGRGKKREDRKYYKKSDSRSQEERI